jgi:single-stranded DNA-binding protein
MNYLNNETRLKGRIGGDVNIQQPSGETDMIVRFTVATNDYSYRDEVKRYQMECQYRAL